MQFIDTLPQWANSFERHLFCISNTCGVSPKKIPGCFFYIGCKLKNAEEVYFNHHPKFDIDEDGLLVAAN
ncbi:peptidase M20 [Paenibacillus thiaminolyticus]|nr:peptidase M20 [Paenibacillus thiaminolyticus]